MSEWEDWHASENMWALNTAVCQKRMHGREIHMFWCVDVCVSGASSASAVSPGSLFEAAKGADRKWEMPPQFNLPPSP